MLDREAHEVTALGEALHARKQRLLCLEAVALGLMCLDLAGACDVGVDRVEVRSDLGGGIETCARVAAQRTERRECIEEGGGARADLDNEVLLNYVRIVAEFFLKHLVENDAVLRRLAVAVEHHGRRLLVPLGDEVKRVRVSEVKVRRKEDLRHAAQRREAAHHGRRCFAAFAFALALALEAFPRRRERRNILVKYVRICGREVGQSAILRADRREARARRIDRPRPAPRVVQHRRDGVEARERARDVCRCTCRRVLLARIKRRVVPVRTRRTLRVHRGVGRRGAACIT